MTNFCCCIDFETETTFTVVISSVMEGEGSVIGLLSPFASKDRGHFILLLEEILETLATVVFTCFLMLFCKKYFLTYIALGIVFHMNRETYPNITSVSYVWEATFFPGFVFNRLKYLFIIFKLTTNYNNAILNIF